MAIEINPDDLRKELIEIYKNYISDKERLRKKAVEKAVDLDGSWSGSFLFSKAVEKAIGD